MVVENLYIESNKERIAERLHGLMFVSPEGLQQAGKCFLHLRWAWNQRQGLKVRVLSSRRSSLTLLRKPRQAWGMGKVGMETL